MKKKLQFLFSLVCVLCVGLTAKAQTDITDTYLTNANLSSLDGWTFDGTGDMDQGQYQAYRSEAPCAVEFYHSWPSDANKVGTAIGSTKTFDMSQSVTLPAGSYRLVVPAYYREGNGNGTNTKAYIYAGSKQRTICGLVPDNGLGSLDGAAKAFNDGKYLNAINFTLEKETTLSLGIHGYIDTYCSWSAMGPVKLYQCDDYADGDDMTGHIVNSTVDGVWGWTTERPKGGNGPTLNNSSFEYWAGNASSRTEASFDYYQEITGLPNGVYTVSADMYNSLNDEAGATFNASCGVYAKSGEVEVSKLVDVEGTTLNTYTTGQIAVKNGTLRVGVKSTTSMGARWFVADNIKLTLVKKFKEFTLNNEDGVPVKYIETGANLITNPNFDDGFAGWTGANDYTTQITDAGFAILTEEGYGNYLFGKTNSGSTDAKSLGTAWSIEAGKTYYYAYDVKYVKEETNPDVSYLKTSLGNAKGTEDVVLDYPDVTAGEWTTFETVFTNSDNYAYCQVKFRWLKSQWGFDNFKLYEVEQITTELEIAKMTANLKLEALPVGDGVFQYTDDAIATAKAAIEAATTIEDVKAVEAVMTLPEEGTRYSFQLKEGGKYMSVSSEGGIVLSDSEKPFTLEAVEGGYAIKSGEKYVAQTGNNTWTMSAADAAYTWVVTALADGYYTITKASNANHYVGINTDAEAVAGTPCYGNKDKNDRSLWTVAPSTTFDITISATTNGTVTSDVASAIAHDEVTLTVTPDKNYALKELAVTYVDGEETKAVEYDENYTFTMPAADVTVAATFRSLGAAYDETLNKWRDAIASITKDDQEFPGQIYDAAVETLMNDADKALVSAQEQLAAGADVKTFDALVATANQKVDEALALAKQNGILPTGEFYFKATNSPGGEIYYLGAGNSWSTQASLIPHSVAWKVSKTKEGAYNLESYVSNGGQSYFFNGTLCDGAATAVAVEAAEDGGFYMLVGGKYLGVSGVGADGPVVANNLEAKDGAIIWERVPVAVKYIKQNDDVTYLIKDADFGRNNRYVSAWTVEAEKDAVQMNGSNGNGQTANFVAAADQKVFTVSQALTGLPNGFYNVTVQGIYFDKKALGKDEVDEIPYAFANDEKVELAKQTVADRNEAGNAFRAGAFTMTIPVRVTDGNLTIGVKNTKANKWVAFDNFSLVFKGNDATDFVASVATELQALKDKHAAAQTEVQGYDDVWNKAANKNVKTQIQNAIKAVDDAIYKAEVKDNTGKVVTPASGIEVDIQKAGNKLADQKATILAAIKTQSEAVDAYLKIARDLHNGNEDANTKMSADYDKLVAQWQDAFDQINTKWKNEEDEKKAAVYNGYLKELNSIWVDVDALDATIKGFYTAGTSQANKAQTDATIKTLSDDIAAVLKNAYDLYNSEVIAANQASLKEVNDAADALVAKYKAAIEVINSHYASYHTVAAKEAQSRLFDLYNAVRQVQSDALAEYTRINEANAEIAKNTTTFPQFEYFDDNAPTVADFKARIAAIETTAGQDNIAKILEYAETAAITENTAEYNCILNDVLGDYKNDNTKGELAIEFIAACDLIDMLDAYNAGTEGYTPLAQVYADDIAEIESAFDDLYTYIEKFKTHVKTEVKDSEPTFTCIFAVGRKIDAKVDELQELIDALAAQVEKDLESNKAAMLQIALDEVQETLDEKVANLATYADDIQEAFAGAYDPAAADLAALKAEVEAAVADGTIDEKADEFLARIGDDDDEPVVLYPYETEDGALTDDMFYEWTTSDAIIAEIVGEDADFVSMIGEATNDVVYGDGLELYNKYANLANYETMIIKFTGAGVPRILINRMEAHGAFTEINSADDLLVDASVDAETGETTWEINLGALKADFADPVNLNVIKAKGGNVTVASIDLVAAKNETIYEKIYGVSVPVENEAAYDEYLADIEDYKEQLETLKDVIDELGAEVDDARLEAIADAIEDADAQDDFSDIVNEMYAKIALVPNEDFLDWVVETTITGPMDDIYDDIYRADLADKMLGVKTNWENAFAANKWPKNMDIDADEVWDEIVKFQEALGLNQTNKQDIDYILYDTDLYDAACERIEEFNLIFTDYEAWIEKFTLKGDMNLDGEITISDVIIATQNALNADDEGNLEGLSKRQAYAADANGDGEYDQSDIVATVNALLAEGDDEEDFAAKARAAEIAEANDVIVVDGKNISLENTTTFFAFTIEAVAADGADVKMTLAERAKGLSILSKKLSNGNTRFVGYSVTNTPIDDTTGILLTANSDITVTRASFSDALAQTHNLSIFTAEEYATGIDGISEGKNVYEGIYTVGGAKVNTLQKGVNIVRKADGTVKKVYVK